MREILFRGKRKDNGEWVEGYLFDDGLINSNRMFIGSLVITEHKGMGEDVWDIGHAFYEVIPETVGQYTGLTNEDGVKIFEGDIIKNIKLRNKNVIYEVSFWYGAFGMVHIDKCDVWAFNDSEYYEDTQDYEVIGNIHDNPELLGRSNR